MSDPQRGRPAKTFDLKYFMGRTVQVGNCRIWTGFAIDGKVPKVQVQGKTLNVRREVWRLVHGELPSHLQVGISCRMPKCIEPVCLIARTRKQAMAAATFTAAGRAAKVIAARQHGVITMEIARELRMSSEPPEELAPLVGITARQIRRIRAYQAWVEPNPFQGLGAR